MLRRLKYYFATDLNCVLPRRLSLWLGLRDDLREQSKRRDE